MPYNSRLDVIRLLAERYDPKSNVNSGGFQSHLQASYVSYIDPIYHQLRSGRIWHKVNF